MGSLALMQVVVFLIVVCHSLSVYAILPSKDGCVPVEWAADWNDFGDIYNRYPFEEPGEIVDGVAVRDLIQLAGLAWNARSWREITGLFCVSYGPLVNRLVGDNSIRRVCDPILSSLRKNVNSSIYNECIRASINSGVSSASDDRLYLFYSYNDDINNIQTVPNLSPTAFELLEWVGPSPFSFDIYGACSALRILLSTQVSDILDRVRNITVHPLAVVLRSNIFWRICRNPNPNDDEILASAIVNGLSDQTDRPLCQFVSTRPTPEESKDRATAIINNAEVMLTDTSTCQKLLTELNSNIRDEYFHDIFNMITGTTLRLTQDREQLCTNISIAFSSDSRYIPTAYFLPTGMSLDQFRFWNTPGELLPGFYFGEALDIAGAFLRADSLENGMILLCDVFEEFISDQGAVYNIPSITNMCASLRGRQFDQLEEACLGFLSNATLNSKPDYNYQYWYNSFDRFQYDYQDAPVPDPLSSFSTYTVINYLQAIGLEFYRRLFQPTRISPEDTCEDLDNYFRSDNNLQSFTRLAVDVALREVIPIAHGICENYREIYDYFEMRDCCGTFPTVESSIREFILAHFGFASREELCRYMADGVDPVSGRATDEAVMRLQKEALTFLTNEQRCLAFDIPFRQLWRETGSRTNADEVFTTYTGYGSAEELCEELRQFFASKTCVLNTAPELNCPARLVSSNFVTPGCFDAEDNNPNVTCFPPAGSNLYPGTTSVSCTCVDNGGLSDGCQFDVFVQAVLNTAPELNCPTRLVNSNFVTPGCFDAEDNNPTVTCFPPAGSDLYPGTTAVSCICVDNGGLSDGCQFDVQAGGAMIKSHSYVLLIIIQVVLATVFSVQ